MTPCLSYQTVDTSNHSTSGTYSFFATQDPVQIDKTWVMRLTTSDLYVANFDP